MRNSLVVYGITTKSLSSKTTYWGRYGLLQTSSFWSDLTVPCNIIYVARCTDSLEKSWNISEICPLCAWYKHDKEICLRYAWNMFEICLQGGIFMGKIFGRFHAMPQVDKASLKKVYNSDQNWFLVTSIHFMWQK